MKLSQWLNKKNRAEENRQIRIVRDSIGFDERWYVSQYQDVFKKLKDPARHYYQKGWKENRDPSENFSTVAYLRRYPECEICPLVFEHNRNERVDLSACVIVKNEAPYIKEWLDYHLLVGVKRFYVYDNESTDNLQEVLAPYIAQGLVIYKYYPGEARQMAAYNECIREYKDMTEWLAVIDADEFIVPTEKNSIPEFLKEFKDCPGVGINWISFDSNDYKKKPHGSLLENYTRVHYDDQFSSNHHIKSIVRPEMVELYSNPHYAKYKDGKHAVDENGNELKGCVYRDVHPEAYTDVVSVNKIRINHYFSKSEEEYNAKLKRGRALTKGAKKKFSAKSLVFDDIKYDCTAYKYAEILYPEAAQRLKTKELYYKIKNFFIELDHSGKPSGLFDYIDEKWYFEQYPDAAESPMTALQHYLSIGWKEGKNPSKYFDTNFYLNRYSDIADGKTNPLLHYLTAGKSAGRLPKVESGIWADVDTENLRIAVSKVDKTSRDYKLLDASDLFDKKWYVDTYLNGEDIDPVAHYLCFGWHNGCNPSKDFDTEFYLKKYKDIAKSGQNPLLHYIKHGKEEGRLPKFEGGWLKRFWKRINGTEFEDDIVASSQEMTEDYKIVENSKLFKQKWYARKYLQGQKINPVEHYLTVGWRDGNKPNAEFDPEKYLSENPDCGVCPLVFEYNRNEFADVAVCAIMKNEGPYVKEWLDYHRLLGVRRFYIYDNESTDNMKEVLAPYIKKGIVVYEYAPESSKQRGVYNSCLKNHGEEMKWLAFIDTDEFIVPKEKDSISEFLKDYEKYSGVSINWVNFDSNGRLKKPKGGVLENYSKVYYEDGSWRNHNIKTIVRPKDVQTYFVHQGKYRDGHYAVDENKKRVGGDKYLPYVSVNKIQLNHYFCKSAEEAAAKGARGRLSLKAIGSDKSFKIKPWEINFNEYKYDYNIYKYLLRLKPEIAGRLKMKLMWLKFLNGMIRFYHVFKKDEIEQFIDEDWYFAKYPEAQKSGLSAREHYLTVGWKKGYNPSKKFDTNFYLKKYPAVAEFQICPLLNYLFRGKYEGRNVLPESNLDVAVLTNDEYVDLSVCAIMKNEAPYVKEWLDYHLSVGVKRFYIYDNASTDNMRDVLDPYIEKGVVVYKYVADRVLQKSIYNECLKEYGDKTKWLAFIDADEFIVPKEKDSIPEFLEDYEDYSGVGINWINFDSNGYLKKPEGGVAENYTRVHYEDNWWRNHTIKSIVKPCDVKVFNVHHAAYSDDKYAVDENKNRLADRNYLPYVSVNKIQVNHYYTKSKEEADAKVKKGSIHGTNLKEAVKIKPIKPEELNFAEYKYDYAIYKYLPKLTPEIAGRLKLKLMWLKFLNGMIHFYHTFKKDEIGQFIDEDWYFAKYPDAKESGLSAKEHYLQSGWLKGYNPSEKFDTEFYLKKYPAVAKIQICPLLNYISHGKAENRQILPDPDARDVNERVDLSVCTIMKNEAPYVKEWLDYHLLAGVKRFYIYDNESTDNLKKVLDPYIEKGLVVYKYYPGEARQMPAYNECIKEYRDKTEWLAVIDADEFIIPIEKDSIPEFLEEFKDCPGVGINWFCFDSNGYMKKPRRGLLESYTRVHFDDQYSSNHHIKSIVRPEKVEVYANPHYAQYSDGKNAVDENGNEMKGCAYRDTHPKAFTDVVSVNKIRINHYYCKSEEEYRAKLARGRAPIKGKKRQFSLRSLIFEDTKYDYTAYKYAERLYPEAIIRLELKKLWLKLKNAVIKLKHLGKPCRMFDYIDENWYFEQYPDAKESGMTAVQHYLSIGWKEGKNPSKYFDTNFYLSKYMDIARAGINPLLHYITVGKNAGRLPMAGAKAVHKRMSSVTVIVPTYNRKNYLEKALNMLRAQTLEDIRFIIVDDGSDDGSADYIKEAVKDDLRFIFIENKENLGPSASRNKALDMISGKYVGFFDIDDEIPADYYEKLYEQAIRSSADIVFTCYNDVQHRLKKISSEADKYAALRNGAIWDKLYSASLIKKNGIKFAENIYTADNLFNIEAFHAAKKIVLTDEPRYSYELHNDSIGKDEKLTSKRKEDIIRICAKAVKFAEAHGFDFPSRVGLYDFLKRTYDCYADDTAFQSKIQSVLRKTGVKVNIAQVMTKYNKKEYKMVRESAYFDPKYYKLHNPQLWFNSIKPIEHYLTVGWLKGKNPSAEFDGNKYLVANDDVAKAGMNPLIHFVEHGVNEERSCEAVESMGEKVRYTLTYPIRVKEEYDRLVAEIKALENMK